MKIAISSGHGLHVPGARAVIDEVTEARRVTDKVAKYLSQKGHEVNVFHENNTRNPRDNVNAIISHHNGQERDLDVSVHFNAVGGGIREAGIGVETLYLTGDREAQTLAIKTSGAISKASGLRDRGAKPRKNLGFLSRTAALAILIEVCFVNSITDTELYNRHFDGICQAIAETIGGVKAPPLPSLSEENLQAMANLGVMNSPDFWRHKNIPWLDQLLLNAAAPGVLDSRIDNGITNFGVALEVLIKAGIVNSPDHWRKTARSFPYLDQLLINIANRARIVLEKIVEAEARGEDLKGQILVANVILNRHHSPSFPTGIYNIVFANGINSRGQRTYQFTPVQNGAYARAVPSERVIEAVSLALDGIDYSKGATFFRTIRGAAGSWHEQALIKLLDHGAHRFYKQPN